MCYIDDIIAQINSIKYLRNDIKPVIDPGPTCHGCGGRGWVSVSGTAQKCPVCEGNGKLSGGIIYYGTWGS